VALRGVRNEVETRNNCGPATLSMALSYWGWQGDQTTTRTTLRPYTDIDDKSVRLDELVSYVHSQTSLRAIARAGGSVDLMKEFIAAGFPVIVKKGLVTSGWIGHYILLTGYDDSSGHFLSQDSLIVSPDAPVSYSDLVEWWRHFNYQFLVVFPPESEAAVLAILGPHQDTAYNYQSAAENALAEIPSLEGRALFFAWHNLGSSYMGLGDANRAAQAFDTAFNEIYPAVPDDERPWRALWYQTDPYVAYYSTGRYEDVARLASAILETTDRPVLEESYYWRGMAREALGDLDGAIADYQTAAGLNPYSTPALQNLDRLGAERP